MLLPVNRLEGAMKLRWQEVSRGKVATIVIAEQLVRAFTKGDIMVVPASERKVQAPPQVLLGALTSPF